MSHGHSDTITPIVWVLTDDRPGNTTQSFGLAEALGWPYQVKSLHFSALASLHNIHERLLGETTITLNHDKSATLASPWPDVVIAAGRRLAPISRWIRRQSQGHTRLIQLGRKGGQVVDHFDVVITPRYCRMPPHPRRIETLAPLNRVTNERLRLEAKQWDGLFTSRSKPHIAVLVGGSTARHRFNADIATTLAKDIQEFAQNVGGALYVLTSRRTGDDGTSALLVELAGAHSVYQWKPEAKGNPYWGCLALADIIVVTGESESMVGEAVSVGKPVLIYPLPEKPLSMMSQLPEGVVNLAHESASEAGQRSIRSRVARGMSRYLIQKGIIRPLRDLSALHQTMFEEGFAYPFGVSMETVKAHTPLREAEEIARRVKALLRL